MGFALPQSTVRTDKDRFNQPQDGEALCDLVEKTNPLALEVASCWNGATA